MLSLLRGRPKFQNRNGRLAYVEGLAYKNTVDWFGFGYFIS